MNHKTKIASAAIVLALAGTGSATASIIELGDGARAQTNGDVAIGDNSNAVNGLALGQNANASGLGNRANCFAIAIGRDASAGCAGVEGGSSAIGMGSSAGYNSNVLGHRSSASRDGVVAGNNSTAAEYATSVGTGTNARFLGSTAVGAGSETGGAGGWIAINGRALGLNSIAVGGVATHTNSITLGTRSITDRNNQLSVGRPGEERTISNVAAATQAHDAVIHQQVVPAITGIVSGLGGGATYNPATGVMTAPSYALSIGTFNNVGAALHALDNKPLGGGSGTDALFAASGDRLNNPALALASTTVAAGESAAAREEDATAIGARTQANFSQSTAIGARARADALCTSIGYAAECDQHFTTSFGRAGDEVRLIHVASGINDTDAVNMGQMRQVVAAFGGGASFSGSTFVPPNYGFTDGTTHSTIGSALDNLDRRISGLSGDTPSTGPAGPAGASAYQVAVSNGFQGNEAQWLESLRGAQGERGEQGERGTDGAPGSGGGMDGRDGVDGRDGTNGNSAYQLAVENGFQGDESEWLASLQGADGKDGRDGVGGGRETSAGRNITVDSTDDRAQTVHLSDNIELSDSGSVHVGATTVNATGVSIEGGASITTNGIDAGSQQVRNVANGRIEQGSMDAVNGGQVWALEQHMNDRWDDVNRRVDQIDDRLQALGAQSAAMAMMTGASTYLPVGKVAVSAGVGFYGNKAALAVGLKARASERSSWSIGISISPDGKPMGGVGYSLIID